MSNLPRAVVVAQGRKTNISHSSTVSLGLRPRLEISKSVDMAVQFEQKITWLASYIWLVYII